MRNESQWITNAHSTTVIAVGMMMLLAGSALAGPSDYWITTKVKISLVAGKNVSGWRVNVDTVDGVVTMHGTVTSDNDKAKATDIAKSVDGVKEVRNDLRVDPKAAGEAKRTEKKEQELIADVGKALQEDVRLQGSEIRVKSLAGGVVLLVGRAESLDTELYAVQLVRKVDGIDGVMSEVTTPPGTDLEPMPPAAADPTAGTDTRSKAVVASDAWITTDTKGRLRSDPRTPGRSINVDTESGVVTLFGRVATAESKAAAGEIAGKVDGVTRVVNELQVVAAGSSAPGAS